MARTVCPRCAEFVDKKASACPFCGQPLGQSRANMLEELREKAAIEAEKRAADKQDLERRVEIAKRYDEVNRGDALQDGRRKSEVNEDINRNGGKNPLQSAEYTQNAKVDSESAKIDVADIVDEKDDYDLDSADDKAGERSEQGAKGDSTRRKRHKHKQRERKKDSPITELDENGEKTIRTDDVTFFEGASDNYSVKKARGEGKNEKIKWWEIYKWADIYLARQKINKEVKKAAVVEPNYVNHFTLLILCLFFGVFGAHNYYAKNTKKGVFVTISIIIAFIATSLPFLKGVADVTIAGGFGAIVVFMWVADLIAIIVHKYQFRESKLKFIATLNLETRKKLGKKYENIKEWFVPFEKRKQIIKNDRKIKK